MISFSDILLHAYPDLVPGFKSSFSTGPVFSGTAGAWPDALETFRLIQETGGVLTMISKIGFSGGCRTS